MEIMSSFCVFKIISLTDVGIEGYILLYGLAVYNISEEEQINFEIPEKDMFVIRKVRTSETPSPPFWTKSDFSNLNI